MSCTLSQSLMSGGSDLTLTGHLGDVMQESAQAARSYLWSRTEIMGLASSLFKRNGIHIHVPEGAIPKDGPSAGVTMVTALVSMFLKTPVRKDTAMTGEISLSGLVLPVGGGDQRKNLSRPSDRYQTDHPSESE